MQTVQYFCPILTESVFSRHILMEVPRIKFNGNPSGGIRADTCVDTRTDTTQPTGALRDCASSCVSSHSGGLDVNRNRIRTKMNIREGVCELNETGLECYSVVQKHMTTNYTLRHAVHRLY